MLMCDRQREVTTTYCTAYTNWRLSTRLLIFARHNKAKLWAGVARLTCYLAYKRLLRGSNSCPQALLSEALPKVCTSWKARTGWDWDTALLVAVTCVWRVLKTFKTGQRKMGGNNMSHQASECVCVEETKWEKFGNLSPLATSALAANWEKKNPAYWCHSCNTHRYTLTTRTKHKHQPFLLKHTLTSSAAPCHAVCGLQQGYYAHILQAHF